MKRTAAICAFAAFMAMAKAQTEKQLVVTWEDPAGQQQETLSLEGIAKIAFDPETGSMTITMSDNTEKTFSDASLWKASFAEGATAIGTVDGESGKADAVEVYDANGVIVEKASDMQSLNLERLPKGVYIIRCGNTILKKTI